MNIKDKQNIVPKERMQNFGVKTKYWILKPTTTHSGLTGGHCKTATFTK